MAETIVIMRIYCTLCQSEQPHVYGKPGNFSCLKCRSLGYDTVRFLMNTVYLDDARVPIPK